MKYVPPSIRETAFNCPQCDVLASQQWYAFLARNNSSNKRLPTIITPDAREQMAFEKIKDVEKRKNIIAWADVMAKGFPFLWPEKDENWATQKLYNVFLSECFNCKDISIWIFDRLVYPRRGEAPPANSDLSDDIRRDYDEASTILDLSPRGAAALIRLAIQKLCKELGQPGENINDDIGGLVANGLDVRTQQALDAVRVIGNNAVHPGQIDLRDNRATAEILFRLTNLIAEKMISEPKHVNEVYATLPKEALSAIAKRDTKSR